MAEHPDCALVRRGYEAFAQGDLDTLATLFTADVTHHVPGESLIAGHHKGREAVLQLYRRMAEETRGTFRIELQRVMADGRGHVISVHKAYGDRRDRGIEMMNGIFFTIVGGKVSDLDECVKDIDVMNEFWAA
ncbi:nuclear transport factor 2 family protein [Streptomyces pathocidini]|uniref:Nuclear transport factor 2 family protein n=1 Tax=Streptomyces pathocidini TaxID=1650571 RepID=A0ABW7UP31_9ACTN|nr:nuclear transport factor 2 family protein [Streptomyces pathocidini]